MIRPKICTNHCCTLPHSVILSVASQLNTANSTILSRYREGEMRHDYVHETMQENDYHDFAPRPSLVLLLKRETSSTQQEVTLLLHPEQNVPFYLGPEQTDTACLLIHGFMGTPTEMHGLGEALAAQGIRVHGMAVAGHTNNPEDMISAGRKEWKASTEAALAQLADYPHVFIAGLSMGGALALLLASRHPERIAGVIALSNLTRMAAEGWQNAMMSLLPLARHFIKWFYPLTTLDFTDAKVQEEVLKQARLRDPNVSIDFSDAQTVAAIKKMVRIPIPALDELVQLTKEERKTLDKVRCPLLIVHSRRDQTVKPSCAYELYSLARAAKPKTLHWLTESDHVITIGPEREEVYRLGIEFIHATVHAAAKTARPDVALRDGPHENHPDR